MPGLNDVKIIQAQGGLQRQPLTSDHISGFLFHSDVANLPGFSASDRVKKIQSVTDAEDLGILNTHADETVGSGGQIEIALTWAADDTISAIFDGAIIGSFTVVAAATATTDVAVGLTAAINSLTVSHGIIAVTNGSVTELTKPDKYGAHEGVLAATVVAAGDGTGSPTQFSSGAASRIADMHYHVSAFYRMGGKECWIGVFADAAWDATELSTIQTAASGTIKQFGAYLIDSANSFASGLLTATQTEMVVMQAAHKEAITIMHADLQGATLSAIADLNTLTASKVAHVIGEEGDWHESTYVDATAYVVGDKVIWGNACYQAKTNTTGNAPFNTSFWTETRLNLALILGVSLSHLGATLGTCSVAKVNESLMKVKAFPLVTGTGLDNLAFATGDLYNSLSDNAIDALADKNHIFARKFFGVTGSFQNDSWTAITRANDFSTIENNRTFNKISRVTYAALVIELGSDLLVDTTTGELDPVTLAKFTNIVELQLEFMASSQEIAAITPDTVFIDPTQNVLSSSLLKVTIKVTPIGVMRFVEATIGFVVPNIS